MPNRVCGETSRNIVTPCILHGLFVVWMDRASMIETDSRSSMFTPRINVNKNVSVWFVMMRSRTVIASAGRKSRKQSPSQIRELYVFIGKMRGDTAGRHGCCCMPATQRLELGRLRLVITKLMLCRLIVHTQSRNKSIVPLAYMYMYLKITLDK